MKLANIDGLAAFTGGTSTKGLNGIIARDQLKTLAEVAEWLRASAVEHYPDSQFAEKHARGFE